MQMFFKKRGTLFLLFVLFMACVVFIAASLYKNVFLNKNNNSQNNQTSNFNAQKNPIKNVTPADGESLVSGIKQVFYVYLNGVSPDSLRVNLSYVDITNKTSGSVNVGFDVKVVGTNKLEVNALDTTRERSEYMLKISDKTTKQVVFSSSYLTTDIPPTPVASNNKSLVPFLPHNAPNFSLEYLSSQNIYIFHFVYNPSSADSVDVQLQKAKNDALQFVKNEGIDPSSLMIEWRNS